VVVRRRYLDEVHSDQPLLRDHPDRCECFAGRHATGLGGSGSGGVAGVDDVDVEGEVHGVGALPGDLECDVHGAPDAEVLDVEHRDHGGVDLLGHLDPGMVSDPAADTDLHEVRRRNVGQLGGMRPVRRVHPLVHGGLCGVDVAVEVDDAELSVDVLRERLGVRIPDAVVAADDHREAAGVQDVGDTEVNLVERLLDVGRDDEQVTGVPDADLLQQVHADVGTVGVVERGDAAYCLRPETSAAAVGRAHVERCADHGDVMSADVADVLHVRRLQEGVDTGEHRVQATREQRDVPVVDRRRCRQP
jgi:hypothetical protein